VREELRSPSACGRCYRCEPFLALEPATAHCALAAGMDLRSPRSTPALCQHYRSAKLLVSGAAPSKYPSEQQIAPWKAVTGRVINCAGRLLQPSCGRYPYSGRAGRDSYLDPFVCLLHFVQLGQHTDCPVHVVSYHQHCCSLSSRRACGRRERKGRVISRRTAAQAVEEIFPVCGDF
jgi:hypothetical protein